MMMLLALPQPGPPTRLPVSRAEAAWSWSIEPRLRPSSPEPPTRKISRRVTPRCRSHRSLPAGPGTRIIGKPLVTESDVRRDARKRREVPLHDNRAAVLNQWLNRNAGLLIRAQAMSWAAVRRLSP